MGEDPLRAGTRALLEMALSARAGIDVGSRWAAVWRAGEGLSLRLKTLGAQDGGRGTTSTTSTSSVESVHASRRPGRAVGMRPG